MYIYDISDMHPSDPHTHTPDTLTHPHTHKHTHTPHSVALCVHIVKFLYVYALLRCDNIPLL